MLYWDTCKNMENEFLGGSKEFIFHLLCIRDVYLGIPWKTNYMEYMSIKHPKRWKIIHFPSFAKFSMEKLANQTHPKWSCS